MKNSILFLLCLLSFQAVPNMANPVRNGTLGTRPFVNQFVDVVHENLFIKIDKEFKRAKFNVEYHINASKEGISIPFLFYASEYLDDFTVKIDGKEIEILPIPEEYNAPEGTKFDDFSYFFEEPSDMGYRMILLKESKNRAFHIVMRNMLYFETDISEGEHVIEVSYSAVNWTDQSNWINEYSFRYALSPAQYWKSFGTLTIRLDATEFNQHMSSNLGQPSEGTIDSVAIWQFDKLPIEVAQWKFQPPMSSTVKLMTRIGPFGLALITGIILTILHFIWIIIYRRKNPTKRFSWPVIFGSFLVPFIFVLSWTNSYSIIDSFIGEDAGRSHGYTFLFMGFYPFILIVYWIIFWLIDSDLKKRGERKNKNA